MNMSKDILHKEKMYVLGPLELSPGQFAVGERSYIAIKGNMPYYNEMRQKFYLKGNAAVGDAIGELEARALTAEKALARVTAEKKSADKKIDDLSEDLAQFKKKCPEVAKKIAEAKDAKAAKANKNKEEIIEKFTDE